MLGGGGKEEGDNWQFIMAGQLIRRWVRGLLCMKALTFCYTYPHSKDNAHSKDITRTPLLWKVEVKTKAVAMDQIIFKDTKHKMSSLLVFNRVYRLEIQTVI
jgi:hypothetical protein